MQCERRTEEVYFTTIRQIIIGKINLSLIKELAGDNTNDNQKNKEKGGEKPGLWQINRKY
ncbi:hypothetical protein NSA23_15250 [Anaerosalibacter massiliensis]|uniref:Uncharacterized protein n=1 Tax=Anaerosalibacter massiliensis TaxID=1347392 RepID=A0A9X2MQP4_9FIRM|nr:hypothetical protein [Anaerosalibacter massiliensis]MCR2045456.1 hypothetical protein [Anaerosalibacter massiliensis]